MLKLPKNTQHASETNLQLVFALPAGKGKPRRPCQLFCKCCSFSVQRDQAQDWMKCLWFANYVENTPFPFRMMLHFYNPQLIVFWYLSSFVARPALVSYPAEKCRANCSGALTHCVPLFGSQASTSKLQHLSRPQRQLARSKEAYCPIHDKTRLPLHAASCLTAANTKLTATASNKIQRSEFPLTLKCRFTKLSLYGSQQTSGCLLSFLKCQTFLIARSPAVTAACGAQKVSDLGYSEASHRIRFFGTPLSTISKMLYRRCGWKFEEAKASTSIFMPPLKALIESSMAWSRKAPHFSDRRPRNSLWFASCKNASQSINNIMDGEPDLQTL